MFLVLLSDLMILLYFDNGYHFLRRQGDRFYRSFSFVGLCHFCFFQDVLVWLDIDFWLLCRFGPEIVPYAVILTTERYGAILLCLSCKKPAWSFFFLFHVVHIFLLGGFLSSRILGKDRFSEQNSAVVNPQERNIPYKKECNFKDMIQIHKLNN